MSKNIEKLEALAEKKRLSIKAKQASIKKDTEALKNIEEEIKNLKGEQFRNDINRLDLSPEEFEKFRKVVLSNKDNLLDVISMMSALAMKPGQKTNEKDITENPSDSSMGQTEGENAL